MTKKSKTRKPNKKRSYTKEDLAKAIQYVKEGKKTTYNIQKTMGIPRTTIQNHIDGNYASCV